MNFHKVDIMTVLVLVVALGLVVTLSAQARVSKDEVEAAAVSGQSPVTLAQLPR